MVTLSFHIYYPDEQTYYTSEATETTPPFFSDSSGHISEVPFLHSCSTDVSTTFLSTFYTSFYHFSTYSVGSLTSQKSVQERSTSTGDVQLSMYDQETSCPTVSMQGPCSLDSTYEDLGSYHMVSTTSTFPTQDIFDIFSSFSLTTVTTREHFPTSMHLFSFSFYYTLDIFLCTIVSLSLFSVSLQIKRSSARSFPPRVILFPGRLRTNKMP